MNIYEKFCDELLANQIHQHIREVTTLNQVGFIFGMQGWFDLCKTISEMHCINKLKDRNHIYLSMDGEKPFNKKNHIRLQTGNKLQF